MNLNLVIPVAMTIVSGLAYLAFFHPRGYEKIAFPLMWLTMLVGVGVHIWNQAIYKVLRVIYSDVTLDTREKIENLLVMEFDFLFIMMGLILILFSLLFLHKLNDNFTS